jgi:glycosyltransferase involved in cell wall biosynthesis
VTEANARPELSLVYPVFDEADNIGLLLDESLRLAPKFSSDFEILVVDDGSRDGSAGIIEEWRRADPRIRVLQHASNRGYGAALHSGLREARGKLVFFCDADLQFDLEELSTLLERAREFDIVAGYRLHRRDPWPRRAIGWSWSALVRALFDLRVRDINCAFKVFHRHVIDAIPIESAGAFINTEILVRADRARFRIRQVPVSHRRRRHGRQSGGNPRVLLRALVELATLYGELRRPSPDAARQ